MKISRELTDYGHGPRVWMVSHGWRYVHASIAMRHPVKTFRHLFFGWTDNE